MDIVFKWETMCLPKEAEWLGVKDINSFNVSLLGKWRWSLFQSQKELWAKVLVSKYEGWRGLSEVTSGRGESAWWMDLKVMFNHPQYEHNEFYNIMEGWKWGQV